MPKSNKKNSRRLPEVDFFRGIAILMMALFHFIWDLSYLHSSSAGLYSGFWGVFQNLTGGLFIFLVGVSLTLNYSRSKDRYPIKFIARGFRIFCYGIIITVFSYFFAKQSLVFFGILHFIGIATILAIPFIRYRLISLILGIAALASSFWLDSIKLGFQWLVWVWYNHNVSTLDIYPLIPWLGIIFLGIFAGNMLYPAGKRILKTHIPEFFSRISKPVQFLGRNSLAIYFIHLPIMFILAYLISIIV